MAGGILSSEAWLMSFIAVCTQGTLGELERGPKVSPNFGAVKPRGASFASRLDLWNVLIKALHCGNEDSRVFQGNAPQ